MNLARLDIPAIQVNENDKDAILRQLANGTKHKIDNVNWKDEYPTKPDVTFQIAHNGSHLFLHYMVQENEILALAEDDGEVWTDSCVEFFMQLGNSPCYYNLESTCIGNILLGYRESKESAERANLELLKTIKRYPSLGKEAIPLKHGDFKWDLLLVIPASAFWQDKLSTFEGIEAKANFYKCGDNLGKPHFLSWSPIAWEKPNFHLTQFFGTVYF